MSDARPAATVRAVQFDPVLGDVSANEHRLADALQTAADDGVDLLVAPELAVTGYHIGHHDPDRLTDEAADALDRLANVAPDVTAVIGAPTRHDGTRYNSAVLLENGGILGTYRKTHLYDAEGSVFEPGDEYPVFETRAGRVGVEICYDVEFPEVARELALGNADLLITISANMRPFSLDQRTYHRSRALENVIPHVLCNRIGAESGVDFFGESGIVDERGRRVVSAGADRAIELTVTVSLSAEGADSLQYFTDRRPATYTRH